MTVSSQPSHAYLKLGSFSCTLGGAATIFGPVLGTIIFYVGRIFVRAVTGTYVPDSIMNTQETEAFSFIVVGVVLMLLVIFRPQGILGNKRELRFHV